MKMNDQINHDSAKSPDPSFNNLDQKTIASFDIAVFLSVASGALYILGWTYWAQYFKYFGINIGFIDLSFYQIIATTWWITFLFAFIVFTVIERNGKESIGIFSLSLYSIFFVVYAIMCVYIYTISISDLFYQIIMLGPFLLLAAFERKLKKKK